MKISKKDLRKLIIVCSVSFVVLWKLYILNPTVEKIKDKKNSIESQKNAVDKAKRVYSDLLDKKIEYLMNKEKNKELEFYLIKNKSELLNMISDIYTSAKNSGIIVNSSASGKTKKFSEYYINNFLNLNVTGSFKNILLFLNEINHHKFLIQANELDLKKNEENNLLELKIQFIAYTTE